jgi:hypothetical protein
MQSLTLSRQLSLPTHGLGGKADNVELSMIGFLNAAPQVQTVRVADPDFGP